MSFGVGRRCGSDPLLLWLWHRPVATALIRPLAWEAPYAAGAALKRPKKKKKKKNQKSNLNYCISYALTYVWTLIQIIQRTYL